MILRGSPRSFGRAPIITPPANVNAALVGDSLTAFGTSSFYWINGLNGGPLSVVINAGVSGQTVADVLARINNSFTNATPGLTGLSLGWVFLRIGTNDCRAGSSAASVSSTYDSLITAILAHCDRIVIQPVPPLFTGPSSTLPADYNAMLRTKCLANPSHLTWLDDCVDMKDGSGQQLTQYFDTDHIHLVPAGVVRMGITGASNAGIIALLSQYSSPLITIGSDVYPAQPQWITKPVMAGTGGTANGGFTGTVADGWTISGGTNVAGTCSKVAADVGDPNQTPWQRVTPTQGNTGVSIAVTVPFSGRTITGIDPVTLDTMMQIRLNSLDTTKIGNFLAEVFHGDGTRLVPGHQLLCLGYGSISGTAVLRSAFPRNDSSSHAGATYNFAIPTTTFGPAGSVGSFDFRCVSARG